MVTSNPIQLEYFQLRNTFTIINIHYMNAIFFLISTQSSLIVVFCIFFHYRAHTLFKNKVPIFFYQAIVHPLFNKYGIKMLTGLIWPRIWSNSMFL